MKKYYYYTYRTKFGDMGCGVCGIKNGDFDVNYMTRDLYKNNGCLCIITFWKEISKEEYEGMIEFRSKIN